MPIKVRDNLPAIKELEKENIFVINESKAVHQDIRPLKIAILNLMPEKAKTESQLLRRLSNSPIQIELDLFHPETHRSKNTPKEHLDAFYKKFSEIKHHKYDGLIITGAPVEKLKFEEVDYWEELKDIMEWSKHNVTSTLHICWAAQAGLYYHYGVNKHPIEAKQFGVFEHDIKNKHCPLVRGFDDIFWAPHSRHTTIKKEDLVNLKDIELISESEEAGVYVVISKDGKQIFITGHSEYDLNSLKQEYERDKAKGLDIKQPKNYYPNNDSKKTPLVRWCSHSNLLFTNWINYYVYQATPYKLDEIN
jgi:homoserine O-succinyltransferase/O-acetyltransferase